MLEKTTDYHGPSVTERLALYDIVRKESRQHGLGLEVELNRHPAFRYETIDWFARTQLREGDKYTLKDGEQKVLRIIRQDGALHFYILVEDQMEYLFFIDTATSEDLIGSIANNIINNLRNWLNQNRK